MPKKKLQSNLVGQKTPLPNMIQEDAPLCEARVAVLRQKARVAALRQKARVAALRQKLELLLFDKRCCSQVAALRGKLDRREAYQKLERGDPEKESLLLLGVSHQAVLQLKDPKNDKEDKLVRVLDE